MSKPVRSGFCSLSLDALALITSKLSAHSICKLYFCGYQGLISKLKVGGVEIFCLKYERLLPRFMRWPRLITQFQKIRSVEIDYEHSIELNSIAYVKDIDLTTIPSSVESVSVSRGTDAFVALCFFDKDNLSEYFPNLKHLYIPDTTWMTYPETFLKFLPHSLLSLHSMFLFEPKDIQLLPDSLTDLSMTMRPLQEPHPQDKLDFPKNLTKLAFFFAPTHDFVASLPTSMTDLNLSFSWLAKNDLETIAFPPFLTSLRLKCPGNAPDTLFAKFPATLTFLSIEQNTNWEHSTHLWYFPPNITFLQIRPQFNMDTQVESRYSPFLSALPSTLKTLDVFSNQSLTPSLLKLLPKSLTSVPNFQIDSTCDLLDCPLVDQIRDPTDKQLSQMVPPEARADADQYYVPQFIRPLVTAIQRPKLSWTHFSMTTLDFSFSAVQPSASHATLLKHLHSLKKLHGLSLEVLQVKSGVVHLSTQLPHTLQSLKLIGASCVRIEFNSASNNEFSSLQVLHIEGKQSEGEAELAHLPPSVTDLYIVAAHFDLKTFTGKNLPRLRSLILLGPPFSSKAYPKSPILFELPTHLTHLTLGFNIPGITMQDLEDLPKELRVLKLPFRGDGWQSVIPPTSESLSLLPPYLARCCTTEDLIMNPRLLIDELLQTRRNARRTYTHF